MSTGPRLRYAGDPGGLAHHGLDDALVLLADAGYDGVALTPGAQHLDPRAPGALQQASRVRQRCDALGLGVVVAAEERGRTALQDEDEPTLVSAPPEARARRLDVLRRCADVAQVLGAEALVLRTGTVPDGVDRPQAWRWLREGLLALVDSHGHTGVALAVAPEPGMLVGDCDHWQRLQASVPQVRLALDPGHCLVAGPYAPEQAVRVFAPHLGAVGVSGVRRGVHEHLPLDEGDVDLPAVLQALVDVGHDGLVTVVPPQDDRGAVPRALALLCDAQPQGSVRHLHAPRS